MQLSFLLEELLERPVEFDYFGVDYEIVWDVVQNKIPLLYQQIRNLSTAAEKFIMYGIGAICS